MTKQEIKRRYTCLCGSVEGYRVYLKVGNQAFKLANSWDKREALWMRDMLSIALQKMIKGDA